jgi:hypothetical protein
MASLRNERGIAILLVVLIVAILGFVFVGFQVIGTSSRATLQQANVASQADNIARAGIVDAIMWFRNQSKQPVGNYSDPTTYPYPDAIFYPRQSTGDTINEAVGLVKEYQLNANSNLWAHYEVRRQTVNNVTTPSANDPRAVHDVTGLRLPSAAGQGLAWYIESAGYVYAQVSPSSTTAYNQAPNKVLAHARVSMEIRRLALTLPSGAVVITNRQPINISNNSMIQGGTAGAGVVYVTNGSTPTVPADSKITGTPGYSQGSASITNFQTIFGVSNTDLKLMADILVNATSPIPNPYPTMAIVYTQQDVTFDTTNPLKGGGILVVNGNLTITGGGVGGSTGADFNGVVYVTGNVTISGPATIYGCLVVLGNLTMNGAGDVADIEFDQGMINSVRQQVGLYRENKSTYYYSTGMK